MKLAWIKYRNKQKQYKYKLFLYIGEKDAKLCLIDSAKVSQGEIGTIKSSMTKLRAMSTPRRIEWLKANVPNIFTTSYYTMSKVNATIVKIFPIK